MSSKRQAEPDIDSSNEKSVKVAKLEKDEQAGGESEACSVAEEDKGSSSNLQLETTKVKKSAHLLFSFSFINLYHALHLYSF